MRRRRQNAPAGTMGLPGASIPYTIVNGVPNPMIGVAVSNELFGLSQVVAFEQATGIRTNTWCYYQSLCDSWPSTYSSAVSSGRKPFFNLTPETAKLTITGGVRSSDGGVDTPMVNSTSYQGIVVGTITSLAATQPVGSIMSVNTGSSPFLTTQTAITSSSAGTQILTSTFTGSSSYTSAWVYDLAGVTSGTYDSLINQIAGYAGGSAIINFAHEMNGNWYAYGIASGGSGFTASQYISMWQHVRSVWRAQESALSLTLSPWVWSPNISGGGLHPFSTAYPGNSYCEYVALDGYSYQASGYPSFSSVFSADLATLSGITSHPQLIGETGIDSTAASRSAWFTTASVGMFPFLEANTTIKGFNYFDHGSSPNYLLDNDRLSCAAYNAGVIGWAL